VVELRGPTAAARSKLTSTPRTRSAIAIEETVGAIAELIDQGHVRHIGLSGDLANLETLVPRGRRRWHAIRRASNAHSGQRAFSERAQLTFGS